ncbi:helix-turn-helix transcriptional regulator [Bradyrhizobium sp.]|uniref:helix-turn-helix transcriptional regulator n=1 Tax=Bradyrhizobium sp. TaxID=376 RepID=UPI002E004273|nr:helix-turn-helix transcriptional regulator [Bradyrhizobium sp.]
MPRAEYERLKTLESEVEEDAGTARLVARAKKEIAGGAPLLPKDTVDRLAHGENPIRVLRQFRGLTQAELATAESVQITQNYLSDLENGKRKGPFELHRKIAEFLKVPFDLLAPIAVSAREANPQRFANSKRSVAEMKRSRGR